MAFTTEFVMGAGGSVEMFEPAFTPNSALTRARLATQAVSTGQWLVAVYITRNGFNTPQMWINNNVVMGTSSNAPYSSTAVVDGPTAIEVDGLGIGSGHVRIVRIG